MSVLPIGDGATVLHVCQIDETQQGDPLGGLGTWRAMPLMLWSLARWAAEQHVRRMFPREGEQYTKLDRFRVMFMYQMEYPSRRKRKTMNVEEMVDRWLPIIRGLSCGHDKAEIDRCEFEMEQHLMPLLAAPVKQLREFYSALVERMKSDRTIPMFVWTLFESWGEAILKKAPDGEVVTLKKKIALRIAELAEGQLHADLKEALVGALQWRSEAQLKEIESGLKAGSPPRLRGKESCLFMVVNEGTPDEAQVML